mmetsp:Transcript_40506/g.64982  ORF Transcript_40506/g.64982 Transcript_40506/m.64982 type:complete len:267 (+) Transcript_40506:209-1009(+)
MAVPTRCVVAAVVVALFALAGPAAAIELECKACRAIGKEVASKIIKEAPWKKHKKRSPSDPLIMSEYEMVSTLETSCNKLKGYNLKDDDWVRISEEGKMPVSFSFGGENPDLGSLNFEKSIGEQRGVREYDDKQISAYCLKIMEDRDEHLSDLIQGKALTQENVRQNVIDTMCSWEHKSRSPCKSRDELMGRFLPSGAAQDGHGHGAEAKVAEVEGEVEDMKAPEGQVEVEDKKEAKAPAEEVKEEKSRKAPSSKKVSKKSKKSEL